MELKNVLKSAIGEKLIAVKVSMNTYNFIKDRRISPRKLIEAAVEDLGGKND